MVRPESPVSVIQRQLARAAGSEVLGTMGTFRTVGFWW